MINKTTEHYQKNSQQTDTVVHILLSSPVHVHGVDGIVIHLVSHIDCCHSLK